MNESHFSAFYSIDVHSVVEAFSQKRNLLDDKMFFIEFDELDFYHTHVKDHYIDLKILNRHG